MILGSLIFEITCLIAPKIIIYVNTNKKCDIYVVDEMEYVAESLTSHY